MKGYTLLELVIAVGISVVVLTSAVNVFGHFAISNQRIAVNQELFYNGVIAMEFITSHVNEAVAVRKNTSFSTLTTALELVVGEGTTNERTIGHHIDNWLAFGSSGGWQQAARYIAQVNFYIDHSLEVLRIEIITADTISGTDIYVEPLVFFRVIDLRYKLVLE